MTSITPMTKKDDTKFLTLHPQGKKGVAISKAKYDAMRRAILDAVPASSNGVPFKGLAAAVAPHLGPAFTPGDSVMWYLVTVKQDLDARGELELVPRMRPQHVRRAQQSGKCV